MLDFIIEKAEQESFNAHWLAVERCTTPLDRDMATNTIGDLYEEIGEQRPTMMFFSSPAMCMLAILACKVSHKEFGNQLWHLRKRLWYELNEQFRNQLRDQRIPQLEDRLRELGKQLETRIREKLWQQLTNLQLRQQLRDQLREQLWQQLGRQLETLQLRQQLRDQLREQLWQQLRDQLLSKDHPGDQLSNHFGAQHWCAWEAFYDLCRRRVIYTEDQNSKLSKWIRQAESCHWWFPYKGLVFASERHSVVNINKRGQLHCTNGPAVAYTDGWALYAVDGISSDITKIKNPKGE